MRKCRTCRERGHYTPTCPERFALDLPKNEVAALAIAELLGAVPFLGAALSVEDHISSKSSSGRTTELVPCSVHPLHTVRVRADGSRSGCSMCEANIEDLIRRRI